jgi:hypothetical protein
MKKLLGQFNEESFASFTEAMSDRFDFARCQRTDGSIYGTGGQCRKGTPTSDKEETKGLLSKVKVMTKEDLKKVSDSDLKSQMKAANDAFFNSKGLTRTQEKALSQAHKDAKAELDSRGKVAPTIGKIKDPVPGVLKSQKETARIKKEAMADQMKNNPKLAKMVADLKARKDARAKLG